MTFHKTSSGKIMHRVLKTIVTMGDIGDVMPWANPEVVQDLVDALGILQFKTLL